MIENFLKTKKIGAFSLAEALVVMLIISIITMVTIPLVTKKRSLASNSIHGKWACKFEMDGTFDEEGNANGKYYQSSGKNYKDDKIEENWKEMPNGCQFPRLSQAVKYLYVEAFGGGGGGTRGQAEPWKRTNLQYKWGQEIEYTGDYKFKFAYAPTSGNGLTDYNGNNFHAAIENKMTGCLESGGCTVANNSLFTYLLNVNGGYEDNEATSENSHTYNVAKYCDNYIGNKADTINYFVKADYTTTVNYPVKCGKLEVSKTSGVCDMEESTNSSTGGPCIPKGTLKDNGIDVDGFNDGDSVEVYYCFAGDNVDWVTQPQGHETQFKQLSENGHTVVKYEDFATFVNNFDKEENGESGSTTKACNDKAKSDYESNSSSGDIPTCTCGWEDLNYKCSYNSISCGWAHGLLKAITYSFYSDPYGYNGKYLLMSSNSLHLFEGDVLKFRFDNSQTGTSGQVKDVGRFIYISGQNPSDVTIYIENTINNSSEERKLFSITEQKIADYIAKANWDDTYDCQGYSCQFAENIQNKDAEHEPRVSKNYLGLSNRKIYGVKQPTLEGDSSLLANGMYTRHENGLSITEVNDGLSNIAHGWNTTDHVAEIDIELFVFKYGCAGQTGEYVAKYITTNRAGKYDIVIGGGGRGETGSNPQSAFSDYSASAGGYTMFDVVLAQGGKPGDTPSLVSTDVTSQYPTGFKSKCEPADNEVIDSQQQTRTINGELPATSSLGTYGQGGQGGGVIHSDRNNPRKNYEPLKITAMGLRDDEPTGRWSYINAGNGTAGLLLVSW